MPDEVIFTAGAKATPPAGTKIATDTVAGKEIQFVKLDIGGDGLSSPVVGSLPVYDVSGTAVNVNVIVSGTYIQYITGTVVVQNFPDLQGISGSVSINNFPPIQDVALVSGSVSVTAPIMQGVSGTVAISNFPIQQGISGTVFVSNFPATVDVAIISGSISVSPPIMQGVSGTVHVDNLPPVLQGVSGTVFVSNLPIEYYHITGAVDVQNFPAIQQVAGLVGISGSISVSNFPAYEIVSGSVVITNYPDQQGISGTVAVSNFPSMQGISGSVTVIPPIQQGISGTVAVSNFPAMQGVSGTVFVGNLPVQTLVTGSVGIVGNINIGNYPVQQGISGTVFVGNWPTQQGISGSVGIVNYPVQQGISGSVTVSNIYRSITGAVAGTVAHDDIDAGAPVKVGYKAISYGANPTAVAANDRTDAYANRHGIQFVLGGHPNIITQEWEFAATGTANAALITVSAGTKIAVTQCQAVCDNANSVDVGVRVGFGAANTPTTTGVVLTHPGIAAGSGVGRGDGGAVIGIGADGEDLRITSEVSTSGALRVLVSYFTIES